VQLCFTIANNIATFDFIKYLLPYSNCKEVKKHYYFKSIRQNVINLDQFYLCLITSDLHIWQSLLKGDESSLKKLMELHYKSLFNFGSKYSLDAELVKDCIQELFIGLWDRRTRLSTDVNPRAYLMASLRRSLHRKIQSENRFSKYFDNEDASTYFDFELSIEEKIIDNESVYQIAKKISGLVSNLPPRQKEVVYLKFFQNLSRDEIASIMGNNPQTVSNLLQIALKKLRGSLNPISLILVVEVFTTLFS